MPRLPACFGLGVLFAGLLLVACGLEASGTSAGGVGSDGGGGGVPVPDASSGGHPDGGAPEAATLYPSCKALKAAYPSARSGPYAIDPGAGAVTTYCDMDYGDGDGWTMIEATSDGAGPIGLTVAGAGDVIAPGNRKYMSEANMKALAVISHQVHVRTHGDTGDSITSVPDTTPIINLRAGELANRGLENRSTNDQVAPWMGRNANKDRLGFSGTLDPAVRYPSIYWAQNNAQGVHLRTDLSVWNYNGGDTRNNLPMDVFLH